MLKSLRQLTPSQTVSFYTLYLPLPFCLYLLFISIFFIYCIFLFSLDFLSISFPVWSLYLCRSLYFHPSLLIFSFFYFHLQYFSPFFYIFLILPESLILSISDDLSTFLHLFLYISFSLSIYLSYFFFYISYFLSFSSTLEKLKLRSWTCGTGSPYVLYIYITVSIWRLGLNSR